MLFDCHPTASLVLHLGLLHASYSMYASQSNHNKTSVQGSAETVSGLRLSYLVTPSITDCIHDEIKISYKSCLAEVCLGASTMQCPSQTLETPRLVPVKKVALLLCRRVISHGLISMSYPSWPVLSWCLNLILPCHRRASIHDTSTLFTEMGDLGKK